MISNGTAKVDDLFFNSVFSEGYSDFDYIIHAHSLVYRYIQLWNDDTISIMIVLYTHIAYVAVYTTVM